jgi:cyclopropane fatty-acyl-phospholipid synthase-like methyltransferase
VLQKLKNWLFPPRDFEGFWQRNCDRRHMRQSVYPALGSWLQERPEARLLDIGCQWYSLHNRHLLKNDAVDFWVVDIGKAPPGLECDRFLRVSVQDLPRLYPESRAAFDVVISFGVLGYYKFEPEQVAAYLQAVHDVLRPGGLFALKLDLTNLAAYGPKYAITEAALARHFQPASITGMDSSTDINEGPDHYRFLLLRKAAEQF